jgi:hypothetical protein
LKEVLGRIHLSRGELDAAEASLRQVLAYLETDNDIVGQAHVLLSLGEVLAAADRGKEADHVLRSAAAIARQSRQRVIEARTLLLQATLNPSGEPVPHRRDLLAQSLAIFTDLGLPRWEQQASSALAAIGGAPGRPDARTPPGRSTAGGPQPESRPRPAVTALRLLRRSRRSSRRRASG